MTSLGDDPVPSVAKHRDPADDLEDGLMSSNDALTAEFRHQIGLLPEDEEGLTEAFKARIGLVGPEAIQEVSEIEIVFDEAKEATLKTHKFDKFALKNFQDGQTGNFSNRPLRQPLLPKKHDVDRVASLSVWIAIQRFMGDSKVPAVTEERDKIPIMTKVYRTVETYNKRRHSRNNNQEPGDKEFVAIKSRERRSSWKKIFSGKSTDKNDNEEVTSHSKAKQSPSDLGNCGEAGSGPGDLHFQYTGPGWMDAIPTNELDLVHYIIGHGILRRDMRDEIYCQMCKQLTQNPRADGLLRGWILLALCAGCFLPTDQFSNYLQGFLRNIVGDYKEYGMYTRRILKRTEMNGTRYHPPNWLEVQATKMRKYVMLPTALADGRIESIEADSAITSGEMCTKLASIAGLQDTFGFSLFICIYDKVSSLGSGLDRVMDAISECEQVVRAKGKREEDAPWRLFFRKEIFAPWHDPEFDILATELIYKQFCKGVRTEEYRMKSEDEIARFVARRWYIEHGPDMLPGKLQAILNEMLPKQSLTGGKSREGWIQAVMAAYDEQGFTQAEDRVPSDHVKWHLITSIPRKWPLQFSGLFEAFKIAGPRLPRNDVVIAVSGRGVYILDQPYRVVAAFHYYEIVEVFSSRTTKARGQSFTLITIKGEEYTFISPNSETIAKLVYGFLDGLRMRSRLAVGLQEFIIEGQKAFQFRQGDVLELLDEAAERHDWIVGICSRTGEKGEFPTDTCYILPTIEKPPREFLDMFAMMSSSDMNTLPKKRGAVKLTKGTVGRSGAHGLDSAV